MKDHFPGPLVNTAHGAVGLHCCEGPLLTHIQIVHLHAQVLFCRVSSKSPQPVLLHGAISSQMQDHAIALARLQEVCISLFLQTVELPLNSSPALQLNSALEMQ